MLITPNQVMNLRTNALPLCTRNMSAPSSAISGQNAVMKTSIPVRLPLSLLGFALMIPTAGNAQPDFVPYPTREELRELQLLAYSCSRANDQDSCSKTRSLADPLMDHPRLSAACKDTVWELVQASQVGTTNSFQRRDSIDRPARRLTLVCSEPEKPKQPAAPTKT